MSTTPGLGNAGAGRGHARLACREVPTYATRHADTCAVAGCPGIGWPVARDARGVSAQTVTGFELLGADSKISTLNKIRRALEAAGVEFIDEDADAERGPGVRLRHGGKPAGKKR